LEPFSLRALSNAFSPSSRDSLARLPINGGGYIYYSGVDINSLRALELH